MAGGVALHLRGWGSGLGASCYRPHENRQHPLGAWFHQAWAGELMGL